MEIKPCRNYYNSSRELENKVDLDLFYCIKPNSTSTEGYWGNAINQYVKIYINKCVNTTQNNNHCYSEREIDQTIKGSLLSMFWRNSMLQMKDYNSPIASNFDNQYFSLNVELTFTLFVNLRTLLFQDDKGFLLEDIVETKRFYYEEPKIIYYGKRGNLLVDIAIQSKEREELL